MTSEQPRSAGTGAWVHWCSARVQVDTRTRRGRVEARAVADDLLVQILTATGRLVVGEIGRHCLHCSAVDHGRVQLPTGFADYAASISYAADVVAVAVAYRAPVGVDIEVPESLPTDEELESFVTLTLSRQQRHGITSLPREERVRRLLQLWTGKEAVLKMRGHGLGVDLRDIPVDLDAGENFVVHALEVEQGVVGSVATHHRVSVERVGGGRCG